MTAPPYLDTIPSSTATYLYRVVAVNAIGSSAASTADLATNMIYTDPALATGAAGTTIKAIHVAELRPAVAAVYSLAGLADSPVWTNSVAAGATIKAPDAPTCGRSSTPRLHKSN